MKMSMLRKHYYSTDNGNTWKEKRPFDSEEHAVAEGFPDTKWLKYKCDICPKFHTSKIRNYNNDE